MLIMNDKQCRHALYTALDCLGKVLLFVHSKDH